MLRVKECKALARRTLLGRYGTVIGAYFITIAITVLMWLLTGVCGFITLLNAGVLSGYIGKAIAFSFPRLVIGVMLTMFLAAVAIIVSLWFEIGSTKLMLNICRGVKYGVGDVFYGFREGSNTVCFILTGVTLGFITFVINLVQKLLYSVAEHALANQAGAHMAVVAVITLAAAFVSCYLAAAFMFAKIIIADKRESTIGGALGASRRLMKGRKLKGFWLMYFSFLFWYILMFACGPAALWVSPYIVCTTVIFYMDADGTLWQLPDGTASHSTDFDSSSAVRDEAQKTEAQPEESYSQSVASCSAENTEPQAQEAGSQGTAEADSTESADVQENAAEPEESTANNTTGVGAQCEYMSEAQPETEEAQPQEPVSAAESIEEPQPEPDAAADTIDEATQEPEATDT